MMASPHRAWQEQQIAILLDLGIDAREAERSTAWVLDNLPPNEDPATWIPPAYLLPENLPATIPDTRADWWQKDETPPQFKRLLDARTEPQ